MTQPLVSVVLPIYNVEKYLEKCITSVVNQTYTNLEIILVDDGSPDRCPIMCDEWAEKDVRIKVIHKKNAGLGMARNSGIDAATGKYIFFFDSDDYVALNTVALCVENAEVHHSDVVIYGRWNVYSDGTVIKQPILSEKKEFSGKEIVTQLLPGMLNYDLGFGVSSWCKMYKLDVLKENSLRFVSERELISEDSFFAIECFSKVSRATLLSECLYYYVKRSNSLSQSYIKDRQKKNNKFLKTCIAYIDRMKMPTEVTNHLIARYHRYTIAHMKQIVASKLRYCEKRQALRAVLEDDVVRNSLVAEAVALSNRSSRFFWHQFQRKYLNVCYFLLWLKTHK